MLLLKVLLSRNTAKCILFVVNDKMVMKDYILGCHWVYLWSYYVPNGCSEVVIIGKMNIVCLALWLEVSR